MHTCFSKPVRAQGFFAVALLSCISAFGMGCSQQQELGTNPSSDFNTQASRNAGSNPSIQPPFNGRPGRGEVRSTELAWLGSAAQFAVLGGSTVTSTGLTHVTGDLGVSPGTAVTGFGPGLVIGTIHAGDSVAAQAQLDLTTGYNALADLPCDQELTGQDLGGMTLTPGVYCFSSSAQLTGTLYLDAQGNSDAIFVFQIASTLTTASNSAVVMLNSDRECNVFWQVGSSATLGTGTVFVGQILAYESITLTTGVNLSGRALARTAAVTMDTDTVFAAGCGTVPDGPCRDKVTGGGFIEVAGSRANFGFVVQHTQNGEVKGNLVYKNHADGTKLTIHTFTSLLVDGQTATFTGTGTINKTPASFTVTVKDAGEPGSHDWFSISVGGDLLEEGTLRGGNIQIHKKKCGHGDGDDDGDNGHGDDDHDDDDDHGDDDHDDDDCDS